MSSKNLNKNHLVSVIIPTFNRANLISQTLDSIKAQTYEHWECIIVDDGSSDNTEEIVNQYSLIDSRFKYFKRPSSLPKGGNSCRNYGFELSTGDLIQWFDSDDLLVPKALERKVKCFVENDTILVCVCKSAVFYGESSNIKGYTLINSKDLYKDYLKNNISIGIPIPMWKRSFLENKPLFNEKTHRGQDFELHCYLLKQIGNRFAVIDDHLVFVRQHEESITSSFFDGDDEKINSFFLVLRKVLNNISKNEEDLMKIFLNKRYFKQILFALRLKKFRIASTEINYIYKNAFPAFTLNKFKVLIVYFVILLINASNGKLYFFLKKFIKM